MDKFIVGISLAITGVLTAYLLGLAIGHLGRAIFDIVTRAAACAL